jgi:ATP-dependent DNA helicase RecQ
MWCSSATLERAKLDALLGYCEHRPAAASACSRTSARRTPAPAAIATTACAAADLGRDRGRAQGAVLRRIAPASASAPRHVIDVLRGSDGRAHPPVRARPASAPSASAPTSMRAPGAACSGSWCRSGLLEVDVEGHGALRFTAASRAVLTGAQSVHLRREATRERRRFRGDRADSPVVAALDSRDAPLFESLRDLRARLAREQNVPAYVIFHDATLRAIALLRPRNRDELAGIGGVGAAKLTRYGSAVLEAVAAAT